MGEEDGGLHVAVHGDDEVYLLSSSATTEEFRGERRKKMKLRRENSNFLFVWRVFGRKRETKCVGLGLVGPSRAWFNARRSQPDPSIDK